MTNINENNQTDWVAIPRYRKCFVCGADNDYGLQLSFEAKGDEVRTEWTPQEKHCGYTHIVHGGVVAALLDEIMGWTGWLRYGRYYFTAESTIRYRKPVIAGRRYRAEARLINPREKIYFAEGRIIDEEGEVFAEATGKYFIRFDVGPEEYM